MSLLIVGMDRSGQRAVVASDTLIKWNGELREMTKLAVVPHLGCVIGGTGAWLQVKLAAELATYARSIDELFAEMPSALASAPELRAKLNDAPTAEFLEQEGRTCVAAVALDKGQLRARVWNGYEDPAYAVYDLPQGCNYISPWVDLFSVGLHGASLMKPGDLERVARAQIVWTAAQVKEGSQLAIGGRLIAAEITRGAIALREIAAL